jgi:protein AroM
VVAGSPYADIGELERAAVALKDWGAELIVLDCIGFTGAMKARAAAIVGAPVILPRTVLARTLAELL